MRKGKKRIHQENILESTFLHAVCQSSQGGKQRYLQVKHLLKQKALRICDVSKMTASQLYLDLSVLNNRINSIY